MIGMVFVKTLLKSGKFWAISGLVIAVLAFARWGYGQIYDAGYIAAELKWRNAQEVAILAAVEDAKIEWRLSTAASEANIEKEKEIIERVRIVEKLVPEIVERVVKPECRDLGSDIQRVFNDAIVESGNIQDATPGTASETFR